MELHIDATKLLLIFFSSVTTIVVSIGSYKGVSYFKKLEAASSRREKRQEMYYMKSEAMYYAISITLPGMDAEKFKNLCTAKFDELVKEDKFVSEP